MQLAEFNSTFFSFSKSASKSTGTSPSIPSWRKTYPNAFWSAGIGWPYSSASKSAGICLSRYGIGGTCPSAFENAGIGDPIPALLKALGQVPTFPYGERPIPALLEALE